MNSWTFGTALLCGALLTACGGGGGDTTGSPAASGGVIPTANGTIGSVPDYGGIQVKTVMAVAAVTPQPSQRATSNAKTFFGKYGYLRSWAIADLDGDGLDDIVVTPTFFDQKPDLPIEIWINKGDGTFENRTSQWFVGAVPTVSNAVAVVVADFNGDGKPDIFISDFGQEDHDCTATPCTGARNHLFLSDATGKWHDASAALANNGTARSNHVTTGVGDLNGDGRIDIAVPNFGEAGIIGDGVILHVNAGDGTFTDGTSWLSDEVGYIPFSYQFSGARPATYDRQGVGATAIADLDGDGKAELITCSYISADRYSKQKTIRFSRWNAGTARVEEIGRYVLTGALEAVIAPPLFANDNGTLGCSGLWVADIDHDGIPDLMVQWEGTSESYIQVLKGKGNLQFDDVTITALGAYRSTFDEGGFKWASLGYQFLDVNGDGFVDIVERNGGLSAQRLATGMPTAFINDGHGRFLPQRLVVDGANVTQAQVEALTGCNFCSHASFYGRFVPRSDGRKTLDLLLMNTNEDIGGTSPQERSISLRVLKAR